MIYSLFIYLFSVYLYQFCIGASFSSVQSFFLCIMFYLSAHLCKHTQTLGLARATLQSQFLARRKISVRPEKEKILFA